MHLTTYFARNKYKHKLLYLLLILKLYPSKIFLEFTVNKLTSLKIEQNMKWACWINLVICMHNRICIIEYA